jgi:two-component system response regulator GlrR
MKGSTPRILLVDNDPESRRRVKKLLEEQGYRVDCAESGEQALRLLTKDSFDLAISETRLPDISGSDLMKKTQSISTATEVIFLTAHGEWKSYIDLMNMGAFDYVNKPSNSDAILDLVRQALEGNQTLISGHA